MTPSRAGPPETADTRRRTPSLRLRHSLHAWREGVRARPHTRRIYQLSVGVVGGVVTLGGLALVPLPGPGWIIVFVGLAILASEFVWADRMLTFAKSRVRAWTSWAGTQSWPVRVLLGLATAAFLVGVVYGLTLWQGVPGWVPQWAVPSLPGLGR